MKRILRESFSVSQDSLILSSEPRGRADRLGLPTETSFPARWRTRRTGNRVLGRSGAGAILRPRSAIGQSRQGRLQAHSFE